MNCIVVDDEPRALDILALFISKVPFLELKGMFRDPLEAMEYIVTSKPDLIFLDINMPELTGIQLLKSLSNAPMVILTTAYSEHAIESYEHNVVDYLLKPIEFERFLKAVLKAKNLFVLQSETKKRETNAVREVADVIYIKSGTKTFPLKIDSILYVEGLGNYVNFILQDKKITTYLSMNEVITLLPAGLFCRIHKSYVISLKHLDVIEKHQVIIKNKTIPIGLTFRDHFSQIMEKNKNVSD